MAGGFMSGFGPAFGKAFSTGVESAMKSYDDKVKTQMAYALEQKTAFEKAKAADTAMVKQAEAIARTIPGAPEEAWKVAYDQLKAGYAEKDIRDEMRKGSWTAIETPEKAEAPAEAPTTSSEAPVDSQMSEVMGQPTSQPKPAEEAPKAAEEGSGVMDSLKKFRESNQERVKDNVNKSVRTQLGVDEDQYNQWLTGYQSEVDTEMKGFKFNVPSDTDEAKNFSQALYQMAIKDPAYLKAKEQGDQVGMKAVLDRYAKQGDTTNSQYDWKGTKASLLDIKDNAERNLNDPDPNVSGPAKQFLEVRLPQILGDNPGIMSGDGGVESDPQKEFARLNREIATIDGKIKNATGDTLAKLQEQRAQLISARDVEQGTINALEVMKSDTATVDVIVRDEKAGVNRTIKARKVADSASPSGFRLEDEAGQPISLVRVASEDDKTTIASFKSLSDEIAKFNTEVVPKAGNVMSVGMQMSQALRQPNGNALTNNVGALANVAESIKQNFSVAAGMMGTVFNDEKDVNGNYVKRITADQWAQQYGYNSLSEMAVARDNFEANGAALAYLVAEAMFGQAGRGLSDTDLIKAYQYIGTEQFNNPTALANRIDQIMVTYMDNTNARGRSFAQLGPVKAYQNLLGMDTVPDNAKTISIQDYASTTPESSASQAVQYYTEVAPKFRIRKPESQEPPKDEAPFELTADLSGLTAQEKVFAQTLLEKGITKVKRVAGRLVPVVE